MQRKNFLSSFMGIAAMLTGLSKLNGLETMQVEKVYFKDDGQIPNSKYPLLLYRQAFIERNDEGAAWLVKRFAENNWTNCWRNGIYPFHHYHSTSHEVLGIYSGTARLHMGGEKGKKITVNAGDVIIIPAGVGHKNLESKGLGVVGAYPNGRSWDVNRGLPGERPGTDKNIAALPLPSTDPITGKYTGLVNIWS